VGEALVVTVVETFLGPLKGLHGLCQIGHGTMVRGAQLPWNRGHRA
jgi:hypothetical protein